MVEKTQKIIGTLIIFILAMSVYIQMDDVRLRIDNDKTTFYVYENRWLVSGVEYNKLFDGTSLDYKHAKDTYWYENINNETNEAWIYRTAPHYSGAIINDTYYFNGSNSDVELFPVSHEIEIYNATGLIYQYEVKRLKCDYITQWNLTNPMEFGRNMKVEWSGNPYFTKVYKYKNTDECKLTIKYRIDSDYTKLNIRLFDPPKTYKNFFTKLVENKIEGNTGIAIFEVTNPTLQPLVIPINAWSKQFDKINGDVKSSKIELMTDTDEIVLQKIPNHICFNEINTICNINNDTKIKTCVDFLEKTSKVQGTKLIEIIEPKGTIKPLRQITLQPKETVQFKLTADLAWSQYTNIEWFVNMDVLGNRFKSEDWAWWNQSFPFKRPINVTINENVTNYQIKLNITNNTHIQSDWDDIRFTGIYANGSEDTSQTRPYWIENKSDSNWVDVWVNTSLYVTSNNSKQIYMYYNNSDAINLSNGTNVFNGFDDGINTNLQYTTAGNGLWESVGSQRHGKSMATSDGFLMGLHNISTDFYGEVTTTHTSDSSIAGAIYIMALIDDSCFTTPEANTIFNSKVRVQIHRKTPTDTNANKLSIRYVDTAGTGHYWTGTTWGGVTYFGGAGTYTVILWGNSTHFNTDIFNSVGNSILTKPASILKTSVKGFTNEYTLVSGEPYSSHYYGGQNYDNYTLRKLIDIDPTYSIGAEESANTPPEITANVTSPAVVYSNTDWLVNMTITDADADTITGYVQFYVNSSKSGGVYSQTVTNNTNTLIATLGNGNYSVGDNLTAIVWAGDGTVNISSINLTATVSVNFIITLNSPINETMTTDTTPDFNFTVSGSEESYDCELFIDDVGYGLGTSYCYQETANESTACGGLDTGSYYIIGGWWASGINNLYDENWATYNSIETGSGNFSINYTKPTEALSSSLWQISYSNGVLKNYTIDYNCWIQQPLQLLIISDFGYNAYLQTFCWNGTEWYDIHLPNTETSSEVYEEAMWWNFPTTNNTATIITANHTITDGTYDWNINCSSGDSMINSSEIRSITIDTTGPIIYIDSPENTTYTTTTIDLDVSANEVVDTWWYSLNSGSNITFNPNTTITGIQGQNNITIYANDTIGNDNSSIVYFFIDSIPPTITIVTPTNNTYCDETELNLNWSVNEILNNAVYSLNGGINSSTIFIKHNYYTKKLISVDALTDIISDSDYIYSSSEDSKIYIYYKNNLTLKDFVNCTIGQRMKTVYVDDLYLYGGSSDNKIYIWYKNNLSLLKNMTTTGTIFSVYADNDYIYGANYIDGFVIWNKTSFELNTILNGDYARDVYADDTYIYGSTDLIDEQIKIWYKNNKTSRLNISLGSTTGTYTIQTDINYLYAGTTMGNLLVYNLTDFSLYQNITNTTANLGTIYIDDIYIYGGSDDEILYIWNKTDYELLNTKTESGYDLRSVYADSSYIYGVNTNGKLLLWHKGKSPTNITIDIIDGYNNLIIYANDTYGNENSTTVNFMNLNTSINRVYSSSNQRYLTFNVTHYDGTFPANNQTNIAPAINITNTGNLNISFNVTANTSLDSCLTFYLSNDSTFTIGTDYDITNNPQQLYTQLAIGNVSSWWAWVDLDSCTPGDTLVYDIYIDTEPSNYVCYSD